MVQASDSPLPPRAHAPLRREFQRITETVERWHLTEHSREIRLLCEAISSGAQHHFDVQTLGHLVEQFETFHKEIPFVTAPESALAMPGITVGRQVANNSPITLDFFELARNTLLLGNTGSGKTTLLLQIAEALLRTLVKVWFFDLKRDARRLAILFKNVRVLHPRARVDLLAKPPYLGLAEHIAIIIELLARATYGGQILRATAHEVLTKAFTEHEHPTITDVLRILRELPRKGDTYERVNAVRNLSMRLQRLIERYPGMAGHGMPAYLLCDESVIFPFLTMGDIEEFITGYFITHLFHHHRAHNIRRLETFIAFEEALLLLRGEGGTSRISGNAVAELIGLTREYGSAWGISANTGHLLDPSIPANVFATIALNASSNTEAEFFSRLAGLTKEEQEYYRFRLTRGQMIIRLADRWRKPLLATFEPWPHEKHVSEEEWAAVLRATDEYIQRHTPEIATTPAATGQRTRIALNNHAGALLGFIARHHVVPTSVAFTALELHPQAGMRAKKHLLALGLIEEDRAVVHRGRGGTSVLLRPTRSGYEQAGMKRHGTRGGDSIQHEWLVRQLATRIPKATIDARIGTKAVDVVISYNATHHERLATFLGITPGDGDLIGIEVEVSRAEKTAKSNAEKNAAVGITYSVIATLLPLRHKPKGAIVVDVFELLEAL